MPSPSSKLFQSGAAHQNRMNSLLHWRKRTTPLIELHWLLWRPSPSSLSECLKSSTLGPDSSNRELDPPRAPSPVQIPQRQLHRRPEPDTHDYPILASSSYQSIHSHLLGSSARVRVCAFAFACVQYVRVRGRQERGKLPLWHHPIGLLFIADACRCIENGPSVRLFKLIFPPEG